MSQQPKKIAPRAKAQIGAAAFGNLRAAMGDDTRGEAMRIPLADIDEDPNQPRKTFDQAELESLAETIKERGVIQAIVVRPAQNGRHILVMGARRFRASKLAGVADIPAIIRKAEDDDYAAQVIENQQRTNLSNSELAAAVARFADEKRTSKQIGTICNLKEYQVSAFRKVAEFPEELRTRLDNADIRALYDLFRQWGKTPAEVVAGLPEADTFLTVTEARRIIGSITGKPTGSIVLDRARVEASPVIAEPENEAVASVTPAEEAPTPGEKLDDQEEQQDEPEAELFAEVATIAPAVQAEDRPAPRMQVVPPAPAPTAPPIAAPAPAAASANDDDDQDQGDGVSSTPRSSPVFIVRTNDGSTGRLVVDQRAERDGWAMVEFAPNMIEEVELSDLSFERIE